MCPPLWQRLRALPWAVGPQAGCRALMSPSVQTAALSTPVCPLNPHLLTLVPLFLRAISVSHSSWQGLNCRSLTQESCWLQAGAPCPVLGVPGTRNPLYPLIYAQPCTLLTMQPPLHDSLTPLNIQEQRIYPFLQY